MNITYTPYIISFIRQTQQRRGYAYYEKAPPQKMTREEYLKITLVSAGIAGLLFFFII